jgi:hypothetical protein
MTRASVTRSARPLLAAAGALVATLAPAPASAQTVPDCSTLNLPNPIYGDGGSAAQNYIGKIATVLANLPTPITVLYKASGACNGVYGLLTPGALSGTIFYWTAAGVQQQCNLPAVGGPAVQWANMVNTHALCEQAPATLPNTIRVEEGPVTAINFITSASSTETSISSEAAYFVYGFGATGGITPWTNESFIFRRNATSAVGLYAGAAISVHPNAQKGVQISNQTMGITGVAAATPPSAGIAYVSSDAADAARATVKTLAYQHKGQICGYLPDSTSTSFDKKNLRDGHYWLWGAQNFYGLKDATTGAWSNANVGILVDTVTGARPAPAGVDIIKAAIDTGNVPRCAMSVWRDGDLGPFYSYAPATPCACHWEKNVPGGSTTCKACTADADCATESATSKCRLNLCEAY